MPVLSNLLRNLWSSSRAGFARPQLSRVSFEGSESLIGKQKSFRWHTTDINVYDPGGHTVERNVPDFECDPFTHFIFYVARPKQVQSHKLKWFSGLVLSGGKVTHDLLTFICYAFLQMTAVHHFLCNPITQACFLILSKVPSAPSCLGGFSCYECGQPCFTWYDWHNGFVFIKHLECRLCFSVHYLSL